MVAGIPNSNAVAGRALSLGIDAQKTPLTAGFSGCWWVIQPFPGWGALLADHVALQVGQWLGAGLELAGRL